MKKKILATKPLSREKTTSKPKINNNNIVNLKSKDVIKYQKVNNTQIKGGNHIGNISMINNINKITTSSSKDERQFQGQGMSDINKTFGELNYNNKAVISNEKINETSSGRNNIKILKNAENNLNHTSNTINNINSVSKSEDNVRAYENLISKMFRYLKDKVPQDVYEEMKIVLTDEIHKTQNNNEVRERKESPSSAHDIINLVTKNSRNNKKQIIDEKVLESMKICEKSGKNQREGGATATTTNTNSNASNFSNAKNLKLSFDFSKPTTQANSRINTFNNKESNTPNNNNLASTTNLSKSKLLPKELTSSSKDSNQTTSNLVNINFKNPTPSHLLNLKGYLNFAGNQNCLHSQNSNIIQKSTDNVNNNAQFNNYINTKSNQNLSQNISSQTQVKPSLFNIIKVGNIKNVHNLAGKSKTQSNSKSKSNSRDSRSIVASISQSKSKSKNKFGLKKETVSLEVNQRGVSGGIPGGQGNHAQGVNGVQGIGVATNPNYSNGMHLKLNANLSKKTGISPENFRPGTGGIINTVISTYNENKFKVNKNINLSSQSTFEGLGAKKNSHQSGNTIINTFGNNTRNTLKLNSIKPSEISILNTKTNQSTNVSSPFQRNQFAPSRQKHNDKKGINNHTTLQNTCYTGTGRDTYISNNTNNSLNLNESKRVISNASKKIMDLTYNVSSKDKESARLSNRDGRETNKNNTSIKYVNLNDIGVINSEATILSSNQKNDLIEIKGENKNKNELNLEMIKEIKLNLDDNLKNMFNFSYEYFHKEQSESAYSTKKSEDLSENDINGQTDYHHPDEMFKNLKKFQNFESFHNQISFDENDDRIKDKVFTKKNK